MNPNSGQIGSSPEELQDRFGQDHAELFHFIGRKVACAEGIGTLQQVLYNHAVIQLDKDLRVIVEPDLETVIPVDNPKPAPPEVAGTFVATDDDLPASLFESHAERVE
jgi:hypothetical protein